MGRRDRSRRAWAPLAGLWAGLLVACLNPRPEEDPSYGVDPADGEPTGGAGAAGTAGPDVMPGGSAGSGGSGFGAGGSGGGASPPADDDALDAGADAGSDAGTTNAPDADAPDAGPP